MGLSALGIFHTAIGVIAIISVAVSYVRFGKIDLSKSVGKIYFYFTLITSLTALGLSKHGGFNPGHALSIIVIISVAAAYFLLQNALEIRVPVGKTSFYHLVFFFR
ncbi:hypothetical protein [Pedobacter sp. GR22-6]|uniref:hypothetical protein n=1 Tax=Pedobacter sp. GR22-6 TaxID=3127957 RepID=UPI00307E1F20